MIIGAAVVVLIIIIAVAGSGGKPSSSGGNPSGVNTNSASYHDGYGDGQNTIQGSAYSVQDQCDELYTTWQNINKAEYMAGCLAGANNSGNS